MSTNRESCRSGFTLIEVAVALAIFAISVIVLSQSFLNTMTGQALLSQPNNWAIDFHTLKRVVISRTTADQLKGGGDFTSINGDKIRWDGSATLLKVKHLYRIEASCRWPDNRRRKCIFHLFNPSWSKEMPSSSDDETHRRSSRAN
jgi:prepilin-type N-terminal cleavage/methylation domain-containing protein